MHERALKSSQERILSLLSVEFLPTVQVLASGLMF